MWRLQYAFFGAWLGFIFLSGENSAVPDVALRYDVAAMICAVAGLVVAMVGRRAK